MLLHSALKVFKRSCKEQLQENPIRKDKGNIGNSGGKRKEKKKLEHSMK